MNGISTTYERPTYATEEKIIPEICKAQNPDFDHHQELIHQPTRKKQRCLKCGKLFVSESFGNRCCGACAKQNQRYSWRAGVAAGA